MTDSRIRLLFVISQFGQGGAERYLFELCSALDRARFDVNILTRRDVDQRAFYFHRLRSMDIPIYPLRPHVPDVRRYAPRFSDRRAYRVLRHWLSSRWAEKTINGFIEKFDVVACIQIENYLELQSLLGDRAGVVIHAMSNRFQYAYEPYDEFSVSRPYRFVTFDRSQTEELRVLGRASILEWPLSMNFHDYPMLAPSVDGRTKRIGIFTRLSREKPLEPLFRCFKELLKTVDATLHVFGGGDPTIYGPELERTQIGGRVHFEGHQTSMIDTIRREQLSMCWLMSVNTLLGYSSIELAATGMPMLFWNFGDWETVRIAIETGGAVHSYNSTTDFVNAAVGYLTNRDALVSLGETLRDFVRRRHNIERNLPAMQDYYSDIAGASAGSPGSREASDGPSLIAASPRREFRS